QLLDALARLDGVGDVFTFGGQDYSMRVWLDPNKLASRNLSANDVVKVLREQNVQVAAGQIGQPPVPTGQDFQYTMSTLGRLIEAEQFASIVLKTGADGEVTYLRDVGRTELGAKNLDQSLTLDGKPLLLPVIDVGVSLIGTFAVMKLMGFSLNNLTLFGLVLAIGIVVDDAIVVLENIERWLDKGLPVREATIKAMDEITGPIL